MYIKFIKRAVERLGKKKYCIVTNGTLLTEEIVQFLNENNFMVALSYDGEKSQRDMSVQPRWDLVAKLSGMGMSTCTYHGNMNFVQIATDIDKLKEKHNLPYPRFGAEGNFEFVHQTAKNTNLVDVTEQDLKDYICQLQEQMLFFLAQYSSGVSIENMYVLKRSLKKWWLPKEYDGFRCCNNMAHTVTLDGRILLCPYGVNFVSDIDHEIDFKKIENRYIPKKCKNCKIFHICKNTCIANITDNECRISREMHSFFEREIQNFNIKERLKKDLFEIYGITV